MLVKSIGCYGQQEIKQLILDSIPVGATKIRVHSNGDFFSVKYFQAWMLVAKEHPEILFYSYTKSLPIWIRYKHLVPKNYVLTASYGGKWDYLIRKHRLKYAEVVFTPNTELPIDMLVILKTKDLLYCFMAFNLLIRKLV